MSKAYRVNITGLNLNLHVDKEKIVQDIELLPILSPEKMKDLLKAKLLENGGTDEGDMVIIDREKVKYTYDLDKLKIEVSLNIQGIEAEDLVLELERLPKRAKVIEGKAVIAAEDLDSLGKNIRKMVEQQVKKIESKAAQGAEVLLLREVINARQLLNSSLKEVYKEAIKEKAGTLGNVTSVSESEQNGEYRLRLEIQ